MSSILDKINIADLRGSLGSFKKGYDLSDKKEFGIVRDTLLKYDLPTSNFDRNLKSLIIDKRSTADDKNSKRYDEERNQIINISEGYDLIHELFHMASNGENSFGSILNYTDPKIGKSLNEGITDLLTYLSSNGEYEQAFPVESLVAKELSNIYGKEILVKHFQADTEGLYNSFREDFFNIINAISSLDVFTNERIKISNMLLNPHVERNDKLIPNINKMFRFLINSVCRLVEVVSYKDSSFKEKFISEFKDLFNENNNEINSLKEMAKMSKYGSIDEVIKEVLEKLESSKSL